MTTIYLKDYQPSDFLIASVSLHFELEEEFTLVRSILQMERNPASKNKSADLRLDGEEMELLKIIVDGKHLPADHYSVDENHLTITKLPEKFILETEVKIKPQLNTQLCGLYKSRTNFCTQCEAQGFRRITYFLDRPDIMTIFSTTISADKQKYPYLLSNGNLIEKRDLANNRHWVHWQDPSKKPCYLFALVAGDFDVLTDTFTTESDRDVDLHLYLEKGFKDQGEYALQALKRAFKWDEEAFGREYDLDIYMVVAVSDFNMGAMENKGLNIFNTKYILAQPETATDDDYTAIETVLGHEYFHNWTGNRVTCRDWFQITLKEGLTVFRDQLFTEAMTGSVVSRLDNINVVRNAQFAEDRSPMSHPIRPDSYIEVNNFYTVTVYRKGSEVIRMIQTLITPEIFRKGMDLYFHRHDGQAVTTEEFVKAMEDASGKDLQQFRRWYSQSGTPNLTVKSDYDAKTRQFKLHVSQKTESTNDQKTKLPLHIPLAVGLVSEHCTDLFATKILEVKEAEQTFVFDNIDHKPLPSLLRGFSAPVKINYDYTDEELAWLMQCDSDAFCRLNAAQQLTLRSIVKLAKIAESEWEPNGLLTSTFHYVLTDDHDDLSFLSRLMQLPSVSYILENSDLRDVQSVFKAREFIKQTLVEALTHEFESHFNSLQTKEVYEYSKKEVAKRRFKNTCLAYLCDTKKPQYLDLAYQQFQTAKNMTDVMGALVALNNHACEQRENALQQFYERWQKEPLVVNKWFVLHASSTLANTLNQVKKLVEHPAYNHQNPNDVYSLVATFGQNTVRFHDSNGLAYDFLADQVIQLDQLNPQVASRVIRPLLRWDLVTDDKKAQMQQALQKISKQPKLSNDIFEIISKSI